MDLAAYLNLPGGAGRLHALLCAGNHLCRWQWVTGNYHTFPDQSPFQDIAARPAFQWHGLTPVPPASIVLPGTFWETGHSQLYFFTDKDWTWRLKISAWLCKELFRSREHNAPIQKQTHFPWFSCFCLQNGYPFPSWGTEELQAEMRSPNSLPEQTENNLICDHSTMWKENDFTCTHATSACRRCGRSEARRQPVTTSWSELRTALNYGEELGPALEAPSFGPARKHFSSAQVTWTSVISNCFPLTYDFPV